ncbi:E3 ubiquitin-protein ligase TRIM71-like isoform X2 [Xenia sp. Carnegie-2017]|uniref:E3 ubiquitin-protein ligase TRIM71-like isoform X2 n=1 Tax=Xenia sp. Carnegie-2017 TaxID=2897299 RepID=UPI001F043747|nr:E3 ubiquitin-protein ligase TRIM71-like isoform X2 [Xenia sp. Carnegie-2017]
MNFEKFRLDAREERLNKPLLMSCLPFIYCECGAEKQTKNKVVDFSQQTAAKFFADEGCFLKNRLRKSGSTEHENEEVFHLDNSSRIGLTFSYCRQYTESLCQSCVYCDKSTKLTFKHHSRTRGEFEDNSKTSTKEHCGLYQYYGEHRVKDHCPLCDGTLCQSDLQHQGRIVGWIDKGIFSEIMAFKELMERATAQIETRQDVASGHRLLMDELRSRKKKICKHIKQYFVHYEQGMENIEKEILQTVLTWYDIQIETIEHAQMREEQRIDKVSDAVKSSRNRREHDSYTEMIFLKPLVLQSKVICGSKQKTEDGFRPSIGNLIRSASWDASVDQTPFQKTTGVILPSILKKIPPVDQNDDRGGMCKRQAMFLAGNKQNTRETRLTVGNRRKRFGVDGVDFHLSRVISRENTAVGGNGTTRNYRYDKISRKKKFGKSGSGQGEFLHPCDVCIDQSQNDRIIVSDFDNCRVQVFSYYGEFLFAFGNRGFGPGQFNGPTGVAVLHDKTIIVSDCLNNIVQLFSSHGIFISSFGTEGRNEGQFWRPMGIAVDSQDQIIVVDQGNNRLQVFTANGEFQHTFGRMGNSNGEVSCPNFVAVDHHDNIYVSDKFTLQIQVFGKDGIFLRKISTSQIYGCFQGHVDYLSGIAVDTRGYVVVGVKGSCSVRVISPDGEFLRGFSPTGSLPSRVLSSHGIALTSVGEIVVCDWFNNRIRFF